MYTFILSCMSIGWKLSIGTNDVVFLMISELSVMNSWSYHPICTFIYFKGQIKKELQKISNYQEPHSQLIVGWEPNRVLLGCTSAVLHWGQYCQLALVVASCVKMLLLMESNSCRGRCNDIAPYMMTTLSMLLIFNLLLVLNNDGPL